MSEVWKPQSRIVYNNWISIIRAEANTLLNDWEKGFINSINNRLVMKISLTKDQAAKLEQIYVKYTSAGSKFGE